MAAGLVSAPGSRLGPCLGACEHVDCGLSRKTAAAACRHCGRPIGYVPGQGEDGTPYGDHPWNSWEGEYYQIGDAYAHAVCEEQAAERDADRGVA